MIHQYQLGGYSIVLDIYSGSVHVVDPVAYTIIALCDQGLGQEDVVARTLEAHPQEEGLNREEILACLEIGRAHV